MVKTPHSYSSGGVGGRGEGEGVGCTGWIPGLGN